MILLFAAAYLKGIGVPKLALASPDVLNTAGITSGETWRSLEPELQIKMSSYEEIANRCFAKR
jgi:hypothetical protein